MKVNILNVPDYLTRSKLPGCDFVINPYIGCPHGCKYCYARFMKRFTNHKEPWGEFVDVKQCNKLIDIKKIENKNVFLSSVTDCYNPLEEKYRLTRNILEQLKEAECNISISTKSSLILRDIDILEQLKNVSVAMSINTLDEKFKNDMDNASSIEERIKALKKLHDNGIKTILFMSPIFPFITNFKEIIIKTNSFVDEYWFENLNLRGEYKYSILNYVKYEFNQFYSEYEKIYLNNDKTYWKKLSIEIADFCKENNIKYKNYFYHEEIAKK